LKEKDDAVKMAQRLSEELIEVRREPREARAEQAKVNDEGNKRFKALEEQMNEGLGSAGSNALPSSQHASSNDFPSLSDAQQQQQQQPRPTPALSRPSFADIAARYPSVKVEHYDLFRPPPSSPLPSAVLPNDGRSFIPLGKRLYFRNVQELTGVFGHLKEAFHHCRIPIRSLVSMGLINTREAAITGICDLGGRRCCWRR
jgi:hypothetical protein